MYIARLTTLRTESQEKTNFTHVTPSMFFLNFLKKFFPLPGLNQSFIDSGFLSTQRLSNENNSLLKNN